MNKNRGGNIRSSSYGWKDSWKTNVSRLLVIILRNAEWNFHCASHWNARHLDILWKGNETYIHEGADLSRFTLVYLHRPRFVLLSDIYLVSRSLFVSRSKKRVVIIVSQVVSRREEKTVRVEEASIGRIDRAFVRVPNENRQQYILLSRLCSPEILLLILRDHPDCVN